MIATNLRRGALAVLVFAACVGCASRANTSQAAGDQPSAGSGCGTFDPGFCGQPSTDATSTAASPTDTSIPGVIMVVPSYINGSEIAEPSPPGCGSEAGAGFSVSIAPGTAGYATPQDAIDAFIASGDQSGYGTPGQTWRIVSDGITTTASAGHVYLDILSLPNARWIVDSGQRCD
jgi:hypothetical protein